MCIRDRIGNVAFATLMMSTIGYFYHAFLPGKADFDAWDGGLAAEAEADDVPLPLEAEVNNLPIRE